MKQALVKLVDVILRRIEEHPETRQNEGRIRSWLMRQGYNKRDIDAAMKLVRPQLAKTEGPLENRPANVACRPAPVRRLSPFEEQKLTPDARAAFARLEQYELIGVHERELILDRLNHFDGPVGLEELDYLLSWLICSGRDYESQHTIYTVFEGEGGALH